MERIKNIWFDGGRINMLTRSGLTFSRPLEAFPELKDASTAERNDYSVSADGEDIRWECLDADIHVSSFFVSGEPDYENQVARIFARFPWIDASEVAKAMGISKSLMDKYIYGMAVPPPQRMEKLKETLHAMGRELVTA